MIIGDFNTTLEPILDRKNYKTNGHKKSRLVINNWISENEMLEPIQHFKKIKTIAVSLRTV